MFLFQDAQCSTALRCCFNEFKTFFLFFFCVVCAHEVCDFRPITCHQIHFSVAQEIKMNFHIIIELLLIVFVFSSFDVAITVVYCLQVVFPTDAAALLWNENLMINNSANANNRIEQRIKRDSIEVKGNTNTAKIKRIEYTWKVCKDCIEM